MQSAELKAAVTFWNRYRCGIGSTIYSNQKSRKTSPPIISEKYDLEYGSAIIETREGQIKPGQRVLIHDDLLNTGGTTEAAAKLVEKQGAIVSQFSFLIGFARLEG